LRIRYNAPVILTFTLLAVGVLVVDFAHVLGGFCGSLFGFLFTRRGRAVL
jgi:hypothetical protein